jgi:hypothetical protein
VRDAALFGGAHARWLRHRHDHPDGARKVLPVLGDEERYLALFHGIRRVAADCAGQVPRRERAPRHGEAAPPSTLRRWFRQWVEVRHRDAAQRTLLTVIAHEDDLAAMHAPASHAHTNAITLDRPSRFNQLIV